MQYRGSLISWLCCSTSHPRAAQSAKSLARLQSEFPSSISKTAAHLFRWLRVAIEHRRRKGVLNTHFDAEESKSCRVCGGEDAAREKETRTDPAARNPRSHNSSLLAPHANQRERESLCHGGRQPAVVLWAPQARMYYCTPLVINLNI